MIISHLADDILVSVPCTIGTTFYRALNCLESYNNKQGYQIQEFTFSQSQLKQPTRTNLICVLIGFLLTSSLKFLFCLFVSLSPGCPSLISNFKVTFVFCLFVCLLACLLASLFFVSQI